MIGGAVGFGVERWGEGRGGATSRHAPPLVISFFVFSRANRRVWTRCRVLAVSASYEVRARPERDDVQHDPGGSRHRSCISANTESELVKIREGGIAFGAFSTNTEQKGGGGGQLSPALMHDGTPRASPVFSALQVPTTMQNTQCRPRGPCHQVESYQVPCAVRSRVRPQPQRSSRAASSRLAAFSVLSEREQAEHVSTNLARSTRAGTGD